MELTPIYEKPILYSNLPITTTRYWDDAVFLFDAKEYVQSLTATLNFINEELLVGNAIQDGMAAIEYPHGSANVTFFLREGIFHISSSFLKVPEKNKVPLLRKVAELNFSPLTLTQIVYSKEEGGILSFKAEIPIELVQPNKIFELIKEICIFADEFDDEFIKKYGASFYHEPFITQLSHDQNQIIWEHFTTYINNAFSFIQYYEEKRWNEYVWDTIVETLLAIVDNAYINGYLRTSIEDKIRFLRNDKETDLERKTTIGKNFLLQLKQMPKEEIMKDVFLSKKFIATKQRATTKTIVDFLNSQKSTIDSDIEENNFLNAFYHLKYAFQLLMYSYNLDIKYWEVITDSLANSSETSWETGTEILKETYDRFVLGDIDQKLTTELKKKPTKKGFFANLFNR